MNFIESFELKKNSLNLIENNLNNSINVTLNSHIHDLEIIKNNHVFSNPCQVLDDKFVKMAQIHKSLDAEITEDIRQ